MEAAVPPLSPCAPRSTALALAPPALAAATVLLCAASVARAQSVSGTVTGSDGGRALEGVVVRLLDEEGEEEDGAFTNARGRFRLETERPGRYRLQAERIGYAAHRGALFRLALGDRLERDVRLEAEGIELSGLTVTSERQCSVSPEKARGTHRLWREARRALEAARWTSDRGLVEVRTRNFRRRLDEDLRVRRRLEESRGHGFGVSPYVSVPADRLARVGYVDTRTDSLEFFAPDGEVLLSESFRRTHCFWVTRDGAPEAGWIGLAFKPAEGRDVPEIQGVLWLDEGTAALRRLAYRYVDVGLGTSLGAAGGEVDFFRLPSGPWIVLAWAIRMPLLAHEHVRIGAYERQEVDVRAYDEVGGQVVRIASGSRVLYDFERATLAGVVWDSARSRPLEGARVELSGSGRADTTDARGRFRFPGVPEGSYRLTYSHPFLERLGVGGRAATVEARAGELTSSRLAVPATEELLDGMCPDREPGAGALLGSVVRAGAGSPVPGARVAAVWAAAGADAAEPGRWVHRQVTADGRGRYRICGVPPGREVALRAEAGGAAGSVTRSRIATGGLEVVDLSPGVSGAADRLAALVREQGLGLASAGDPQSHEGAAGSIAGTVRASGTGGRPLPAAEVRLDDRRSVVTDSAGRFGLDGVSPGTHRVRVRYLGLASQEGLVRVSPGDTVDTTVLMETDPVPLPGLAVRVSSTPGRGKLAGFERRRKGGRGHFLTREEIARAPGPYAIDALRTVPGIRVELCPQGGGQCIVPTRSSRPRLGSMTPRQPARGAGGDENVAPGPPTGGASGLPGSGISVPLPDSVPRTRRCGVAYWVDGVRVASSATSPGDGVPVSSVLDAVPKDDLEGIEVYAGPAQIPARFRAGCADVVVVVWTRPGA